MTLPVLLGPTGQSKSGACQRERERRGEGAIALNTPGYAWIRRLEYALILPEYRLYELYYVVLMYLMYQYINSPDVIVHRHGGGVLARKHVIER